MLFLISVFSACDYVLLFSEMRGVLKKGICAVTEVSFAEMTLHYSTI